VTVSSSHQDEVCWVLMPYTVAVGYHHFEGNMMGILPCIGFHNPENLSFNPHYHENLKYFILLMKFHHEVKHLSVACFSFSVYII
jgi:hypothetical protein